MNRLTRDQIILRALNHLDSPRLDEKCRGGSLGPGGTVTDPCLMTQWLQDGIDLAHNLYPLQGRVASQPFTLAGGTGSYALPTNYVLPYGQNSIVLTDAQTGQLLRRLMRRGFEALLPYGTTAQDRAEPTIFSVTAGQWHVRPIPDKAYTATFWHYALPAVLGTGDVPDFPSDYLLIDYLVERGKEWLRESPGGVANLRLRDAMSQLVKAGLGQEAEEDQIPVDRDSFPGSRDGIDGTNDWMGKTSVG